MNLSWVGNNKYRFSAEVPAGSPLLQPGEVFRFSPQHDTPAGNGVVRCSSCGTQNTTASTAYLKVQPTGSSSFTLQSAVLTNNYAFRTVWRGPGLDFVRNGGFMTIKLEPGFRGYNLQSADAVSGGNWSTVEGGTTMSRPEIG